MNKAKLNYIVDILTGLALIVSVVTGILLIDNHGGGGYGRGIRWTDAESTLVNMNLLRDAHTISSIIMAVGAAFHLILHLSWLKCMTLRIFRRNKKEICNMT